MDTFHAIRVESTTFNLYITLSLLTGRNTCDIGNDAEIQKCLLYHSKRYRLDLCSTYKI